MAIIQVRRVGGRVAIDHIGQIAVTFLDDTLERALQILELAKDDRFFAISLNTGQRGVQPSHLWRARLNVGDRLAWAGELAEWARIRAEFAQVLPKTSSFPLTKRAKPIYAYRWRLDLLCFLKDHLKLSILH